MARNSTRRPHAAALLCGASLMAAAGLVGSYKGSQAREAMITVDEWDAMQAARQADAESGMTV